MIKFLGLNERTVFRQHTTMNIFDEIYKINAKHPEKRAMSMTMNSGEQIVFTYGELFAEVDKYAKALLSAGVKAGDRIAFAGESSPFWVIAFFASCKIHCTAALIDASLTGDDIVDFVNRSDVRSAFFSEKAYKKISETKKFVFPVFNIKNCTLFPDSVQKISEDFPASEDTDENVACIIFSSGTTRKAAGILHFHDSLINTTKMTQKVQDISEQSRFLGILPLSHIYGLFSLVLGPTLTGSQVHFIESISADAMLKAFAEYKPTVFPAVPKVYELFKTAAIRKINAKPITKFMFDKLFPVCYKFRETNGTLLGKIIFKSIHETFGGCLERLFSGGAPLSKDVADFYYALGFNILSTYGASETNVPTLGNTVSDIRTDSCGKPYPAVQVKLSADGELLIKTPLMMKGYFRDEEATREAFTDDGWFKSGDKASIDADGNIKLEGRTKENIVLSTGKKVSPEELEAKYRELKNVKDFVICGVPAKDADYDEIHAFVVSESNTPASDIEAQISTINADVPQNMRIHKIHFVSEIPKTSLQKPKRYILKQQTVEQRHGSKEVKETKTNENGLLSQLIEIIAKISNTPPSKIDENTNIFTSLAIDSLSAVDLAMEIESVYKVNVESAYFKEMAVKDLVSAVENGSNVNEKSVSRGIYPQKKTERDYKIYSKFKSFAKFCYNINVVNAENLPKNNGFIICPNHVTKIDYLFVSTALPKERFMKLCCMAKIELFRKDIFSKQLIKSTGMVPVDRGGMNMNTMNSIKAKLKEGWCVLIHPEGTRSEDGIFRKIKSGASVLAIDTNVPVVPVYINGAYELFPKNKKMIKFYDTKNKKRFDVDVIFGKAIYPDNKTTEELTNEIQNAILELQSECIKN